eukprot:1064183-Alexandrium_andersonii.AAC.1
MHHVRAHPNDNCPRKDTNADWRIGSLVNWSMRARASLLIHPRPAIDRHHRRRHKQTINVGGNDGMTSTGS